MFDTTVLETSPSDERRRIWQRYKAGELDVEAVTALLRIDIDALVRARHNTCGETQPMGYLEPSRDEIRNLIQAHWRQHPDLSKRLNADDEEFLDAKVAATQFLMQKFIRGGMEPLEAERRALKSVALAD